MAEIDGGALSFKSVMDNDQMNAAIDETLRRVQGLSDETVVGGQKMDAAFDNTADGIRNALGQIGAACEIHEQSLQSLEAEYQRLGQQAGAAFANGRDEEYTQIKRQQEAIKGEIIVRQKLLKELRDQSNELERVALKQEENKQKTEANANAQVSMRTRIKEVREEMMLLVDQGIDEQSEAYQRLKNELGRLIDIQGDVAQQGKILANDEQKYQGIIQGLSGLAGGFSAVTGTISLFAGENEDLQKVMTKVQSVMAITIGLQQVAQTLNKDSAFQLVTLNGLKEWWAGVVTKATVAETAETIATTANTAAQTVNATATGAATTSQAANTLATGGQAVAAKVGTIANIGLAGAFRLVGVAIKSIPVFGWILAGISALVGLVAALTSESRKAAKETKEMNAAIVEGSYKAIGSVKNLSSQWASLGDNLDAKKKFIEQNKKAFDELGVSIRDVADAEKLLADGAQAFIDAQIAKAKAAAVLANSEKWVKKSVEADLELEQAKKKPKVTRYVSGGQFGGGYSYEIDNPAIKKAEDKQKEANEKLQDLYVDAAKYTAEGLGKMKEAGVDGQDKITEGTVAWYEKQISDKQAHLKTLSVLDNAEIKSTQKQIADYQKIIDDATGKKTTGGSSNSQKDPFLEKLEKQKKEYTRFQKWMNSGDDVLSKAATAEFDGLLKQGATYIDYLKKQRDELIEKMGNGNATNQQTKELQALNNAISDETKITVIDAFNTKLSEQLDSANSVIEKLKRIADMRQELKGDGTDVDNTKKETLDNSEKEVVKQAQDEYKVAMQEHSDYLDSKIKADIQYVNKRKELENQLKDTKDPKQREVIQTQIKTLDVQNKTQKSIDYDSMLEEFQSYQQKRQSMSDDFDTKIALATEKKNDDLVKRLEEAKANALSDLDMNELMDSDTWNQLFGNLDNLTASEMIELRNKVESEWDKLKLSPKQLEALRNEMGEVTTKVEENNPFLALADAVKRYKAGEEGIDFKDIAKSAADSIDLVSGALDAVVGGMEKMGIQMDEETQAIIGDIGGILDGASQLASGIATGNPLAIIQGGIGLLSSAFSLFNSRDRKAERSIKRHAESLKKLQSSYEDLERVIERALGGDRYSSQKNSIENLKQQQVELSAMADAERSKKKSDKGKIEEYEKTIKDNANQIADIITGMREELLGLDAASAAEQLGSAFIDAFSSGEDAAAAWGAKVDDIVGNIMQKMLIQKLLEQPMGAIFEKYSKKWYDDNGNFAGFDAVMSDAGKMGEEMKGLGSGFATAMANLPDEIKKYFIGDVDSHDADTSLTGAVKGVSEDTASLVAGQMNAIRINQMEATAILRQQLAALATIANNTSYNFHLAKLERIVTLLENSQSSSSLRSQGLL